MKNTILANDPRTLQPGVTYADGRSSWGGPTKDFDPTQPKYNEALARRNWTITPTPPSGPFSYLSFRPDGTFGKVTFPDGSLLGQPNFPGVAVPYPKYDKWLAEQPNPVIARRLDSGAVVPEDFTGSMKVFVSTKEMQDAVEQSLKSSGFAVTIRAAGGGDGFEYGPGSARIVYLSTNGMKTPDGNPVFISVGAMFKRMSSAGVGYPGKWVADGPGKIPTFVPDERIGDGTFIAAEWPTPMVIPTGYEPVAKTYNGIVSTGPGFVEISDAAPDVAGGSVDLTGVNAKLDRIIGELQKLIVVSGMAVDQ